MPRIPVATGVTLGYQTWGDGDIPVAFIHGNLASKLWFSLVARRLPRDLRVVGIDWRGCGESDRVEPGVNFAGYTMEQHAADMLAALDALGIGRCHLATHSTGGYIAALMELAAPGRFGRILHLDPVTPKGLRFDEAGKAVFAAMKSSKAITRAAMATAAPTLFAEASLTPGCTPALIAPRSEPARLFRAIIDETFTVSDGIWLGTPHHLNAAAEAGGLVSRMAELKAETLILWGELDLWIPRADVEEMARGLPNARLVKVPGIGHSMNLEAPDLYGGYFAATFSAVPLASGQA